MAAALLLMVCAAATLTACSGGKGNPAEAGGPKRSAVPAPSLPGAPFMGDLKPVLQGLMDRDGSPKPRFWPVVHSFVVQVPWAQLQPTENGPIAADNPIDNAINTVRAGATQGGPALIKLRVMAGVFSPEWAKHLGGDPIAVRDSFNGGQGTVPHFWTPQFDAAYRQLQEALAKRYDNVAEIAETTIDECMTFTAEPMIRQINDGKTAKALLDAGFTVDADQRCQRAQVDAAKIWTHTRSGLSLNPYQRIEPSGEGVPESAFAIQLLQYCRQTLGPRCVLENHSIRWPPKTGPYADLYTAMVKAGAPISYQTATPDRIGDWQKTLQWAVENKGNSVELNHAYGKYDMAVLADFAKQLDANPV